jgi:multicomponent Na+:H+ antiporter subunit D
MTQHLPALLFCIPLLTAISMPMVGLRHRGWCRPMALAAVGAMSVTAVVNLVVVLSSGEIRYAFGGWAPPIGIEWVADGLASVMMVAICLIASICLIYGGTVSPLPAGGRVVLYYTLILLLLSGLTGAVFAADLFNVFVFLEVVALSVSALVGMAGGKALVFAFRYLILASIGATFYLLGVSFFYAATGTLNMADLAQRVPALLASKAVIGGLVFMFIGLGIKMALMPLHGWLPDAYSYAPDAVSPLLSALVTKVSLLVWARILYWAVGAGSELETTQILRLVWVSGALASVVGAFLALTQRDVKRVFAYGGLSHIGLILIGVGQGNQTGLAGAMFYLINDAVMQATLFVVAGAAIHQYGVRTMEDLGRLRGRAPWITGAIIIVAMSMIGIPPTGGFFGKWYIILGALRSGNYLAVGAVMVSTLLTLAYFIRLWVRVFGGEQASPSAQRVEAPFALRVCVGTLSLSIIALGLCSDRIVRLLLDTTTSLGL